MDLTARERRPTWELTDLLVPHQGDWTAEEYLKLHANRLIEFTDGYLEFLPMPDDDHFYVQQFIFAAVEAFLRSRGKGTARYAPWKVRVRQDAYREPDICVLLDEKDPRRSKKYWRGADLVVEVVSPKGEERDYVAKREEYAGAHILEYWVVDPAKQEFLSLRLDGPSYREHARLTRGDVAVSLALPGFTLDVGSCFDAMKQSAEDDDLAAED